MEYEDAWLRYRKLVRPDFETYVSEIRYTAMDDIIRRTVEELQEAIAVMFGKKPVCGALEEEELDSASGIILYVDPQETFGKEGFHNYKETNCFMVKASQTTGILYGVFELLRGLMCGKSITEMEVSKQPDNPLRMINHWDNMDSSIERGYSGNSFFFEHGRVIVNDRTKAYARLMASIGINGIVINNVNVREEATKLITTTYIKELKQMGELFSSYGISLFLSINFAAPMELGGLSSADPEDIQVKEWWQEEVKLLFKEVKGFGGFLVKADSEGRPGPFTYGRTHAQGANMLAEAVKPYGGIIIWRCFVYNCKQDWRDLKTDRARAGYDNFYPLDGQFQENVILQIKNGPMDFQVREPVSPLLGAMKSTNQMLEVQIAQEYTGQQRHVCYLIPMWKEVLEFKTYCKSEHDQVKDIVSGKCYGNQNCGIAAVTNTGSDANWTGHDLAAANLYGYGRLCFSTTLSAEEIASEWIAMTYGNEPQVQKNIEKILMMSWPAYEKYTSPLGIGWMVNPSNHYGPNVDGYEYDRWGTYHKSNHLGMGVERSSKGTGYSTQYFKENAERYETIENCPEELLLFFHRVAYTYQLSTGKTLIQHIYDSHFEGVEDVEVMCKAWEELKGYIDEPVFTRVQKRMKEQYDSSIDWRDIICSYYYRMSGIQDNKGRTIYE